MLSSPAFAKINLLLKVTGRRNDGYHLLDSLVGFCEFGDRLEISLNEARDEIITEGTFGRREEASPEIYLAFFVLSKYKRAQA